MDTNQQQHDETQNDDTQHEASAVVNNHHHPLPTPIKGKADWRDSRCFQLVNGVTVCLVHDKKSKTTAASATVTAGASADPREMSGLAHFCEHMCFLGSEKYPGENEYKSYLAQHGGRSNASTSMHLTTYKFEILADFAEHALDIFSHFFTEPLFTASGTGREVNAVDSENSKNLTADARRRLQILKDLADQKHYYSKFSTGNAQTLPTDSPDSLGRIREALLSFHRKHYRPENLTVVVAGPQSLDQLQEWVVPRFATMQARAFPEGKSMTEAEKLVDQAAEDAPPYHYEAPEQPFTPAFRPDLQGKWPALLTAKPVRSMRRLVLMFPLPPVVKAPDQSPSSVLSHLLGHEGPSSPFAVLQNEGLLSSLSAGPRIAAPDFTLFQIDMSLTDKGEPRWKEVADVIFQHCRLIASAAEQALKDGDSREFRRIWGEKASLNAMFFHQTSPGGVYSLAPSLSNSIVLYGTEKSFSAGSMLNESEETLPLKKVADFARKLIPANCLVERCSEDAWKEMEATQVNGIAEKKKEQWYGIDYFLSKLDEDVVQHWSGETAPLFVTDKLALPSENLYIPRSLEICEDLPEVARIGPRIDKEIEPPDLLIEDEKVGRLWHRLDDRYALPKSSLSLLIRNAAVDNLRKGDTWLYSSDVSVHSTLLTSIFAEALAQDTYDASLAGLQWSLSVSPEGIRLSCGGFSDRLSDLTLKLLDDFLSGGFIQESYFLSAKDRILRSLRTYFQSRRADSHSMYYRDFMLAATDTGLEAAIKAVEEATVESTKAHHRALLQNDEAFVDCLYSGNVSELEAKTLFSTASDTLSAACAFASRQANPCSWVPGSTERRLVPGSDVELHFTSKNEQEENGSVVVTYQSPIPGFRGESLSDPTSLRNSAALRLLCHILREPLFDELRTKQTLGYIVSSYYDIGFSSAPPNAKVAWTVPVDYVVISVLSRKVAPSEVLKRIDEFLVVFRESLVQMPESEIADHASALSTKLLKPIQKLGTEASNQFSKIRRFAPEVLTKTGRSRKNDLAWDNSKVMAATIRSLDRNDILTAWDRLILPRTRARVVSCVYGSTFPLHPKDVVLSQSSNNKKTVIVDNLSEIVQFRRKLASYDNTPSRLPSRTSSLFPKVLPFFNNNKSAAVVALVGVAAVMAAGAAAGWAILGRSAKRQTK